MKFIALESGIKDKWIVGVSEDKKNICASYRSISGLKHEQCDSVIRMLEYVYAFGRRDKALEITKALEER